MRVARGDAVALMRELVRVDSRNPSLAAGGPGEAEVARVLCAVLTSWGLRAAIVEAAPGRPNVVARIGPARAGWRSLMFNGHLDVVGVEGMVHEPWSAEERGGKVYGRGTADMKSGIAAMCAAAVRAADMVGDGEIVIAAVADEEFESIGTRALLASGVRTTAAIVTEPTRLAIMPAHLGFVWLEVTTHGRAAHGSRWELGVDAIRHAGLVLAELDRIDREILPMKVHSLLGRASVHASLIDGGTGMSTYPDRCAVRMERRTVPGETPDDARGELLDACARVAATHPTFRADVGVTFAQAPSDVPVDAPIVRALQRACGDAGEAASIEGMSAWTDAALLNAAGIPAICFGPGDIAVAHAAEEWVSVSEVNRAVDVLTRLAASWCGERDS